MTTSSSCQLWAALGFIMLMYIDMATAPPPCLAERQKRQAGGVCYTQQTYTYRQSYRGPCTGDYYRRKRARPYDEDDCYRPTAYRMATGHRTVSSCCRGYEWDSRCNGCYLPVSCPGGCLNGGTCVGGTCRCRPGYSGTRCETAQQDPVLTVTLTQTQRDTLDRDIISLLGATGGTFDPSRLNDKDIYNHQLIDLTPTQKQTISDSCSKASEILRPSERKKRTGQRVCPGDRRTTSLVAFTGSGNRQVGQLVWLNEQTPWAFNEECSSSTGRGPGGSCRCEKVESTSKALVLVINVGGHNAGVDAVWKDVTIRHCAATYYG